MTYKDKIKEEIESYKESMKGLEPHSDFRRGQITAYNQILQFIDSLPEEPKCIYNRTFEERKETCKYCSATCSVRIEEEPVSKDLEEEVSNWRHNHFHGRRDKDASGEYLERESQLDLARHFAEWGRKQMMKDAVDGQVVYQIGSAEIAPTDIRYKVVSDRVYIPNVKLGDKVKIIVIKED